VARRPRPQRARLLVLGAGPAQLGLLEAARARGDLHLIAADRDPQATGFALADERALISTEDEPAIERLARARRVDGLVSPGADWPVAVAARVAERMGLPHPLDAATAAVATSKLRQRERFAAGGVPQPRSRVVTAPGDDPALPPPWVVKAPDRQGQRGLTLVRRRRDLPAAIALAVAESRSGTALVEELVDGSELTVNGIVVDGALQPLTVTDRVLADPPAFGVALAHVWPCESPAAAAAAVAVADAAVRALGIGSGPVYVQVRIGRDGPRVMEVAARLGGGHDAELSREALGVDLAAAAVALALGEEPALDLPGTDMAGGLTPVGGACVRFLVAPAGTLRAVGGLDVAAAVEGVRWVRSYRVPGWRFVELRRGADRAGAVLAVAASRADALERADRAAQAVRFQVDADTA
jgi:biotin carboxylase